MVGAEGVTDERIAQDVDAIEHLVAETGAEVAGPIVQVGPSTWVVYGTYAYEGEVIVGEYSDPDEAAAVLRATPTGDPDPVAGVDLEGPSWWKEY
jgi:hypothetical protein